MVITDGSVHLTLEAAQMHASKPSDVVWVEGSPEAIEQLSAMCKRTARERGRAQARRKAQRQARRRNR